MKGDPKGGGGWLRDGKEGLVLETGGAKRERNRSVLWVIIGNRKSTRKRLVRGNKTEKRGWHTGRGVGEGRKEGGDGARTRDTRAHDGATSPPRRTRSNALRN